MVRSTVEKVPHFEVCGEAVDGARAIEQTQRLKPDVVVLNVTMPVLNGFEAAREIKIILPETAIVILSSHADQRFVEAAKKIGVRSKPRRSTRSCSDSLHKPLCKPGWRLVSRELGCAVKGGGPQRELNPPGNWFAPPGSNRSRGGGNEAAEDFDVEGRIGDSASMQAVT